MNEWIGVKRGVPCPICLKEDWCLLHVDGKKCICPRVKSNVRLGESGWLHKVWDNGLLNKSRKPSKAKSNHLINWVGLNRHYQLKSLRQDAVTLNPIFSLGLSAPTLVQFGIGWDGEAYTFPAYDGYEDIVGIMRRFPDGHKVWVSRSRNGLFIPKMKSWEGNLFICEGLTDAAALVDLGFRAIGRANCQTGTDYIKILLHRRSGIHQTTIVGDHDPDNIHGDVGQRGAEKLARALYGIVHTTGCLEIPDKYKDVRQWCQDGATKEQIILRSRMI